MKQLLVEAMGTFFLVLTIGLTVLAPGAGAMAPVAIGAILMVMVYAGGPVSGGYYNPAVTLAVWLRGKMDAKDVPGYMGAQVVGAVLAALIVAWCKGDRAAVPLYPEVLPALVVETLFTFALAFVVLSVATTKQAAGNSYFGLAIGSTVMVGAYAAGNISGAVFNPAVAIGITLMGAGVAANLWIYLVANLLGGVLAAAVFGLTNPDA